MKEKEDIWISREQWLRLSSLELIEVDGHQIDPKDVWKFEVSPISLLNAEGVVGLWDKNYIKCKELHPVVRGGKSVILAENTKEYERFIDLKKKTEGRDV